MTARQKLLAIEVAAVALPIAIAILVIRATGPAREVQARLQELGPRYRLERVGRVDLYSADPEHGAALARDLVSFSTAFVAELGPPFGLSPFEGRFTLVVLDGHDDFTTFANRFMREDLPHSQGFFEPTTRLLAVERFRRHGAPEELAAAVDRETLFHEATHFLFAVAVDSDRPDWSPWFAEGLADWFEGCEVRRDGSLSPPRPRPERFRTGAGMIRRGELPRVGALLEAPQSAFAAAEADRLYVASYLLVAYLLAEPRRREAFGRYYALEKRIGPVPRGALPLALGTDADALEEGLREWVLARAEHRP